MYLAEYQHDRRDIRFLLVGRRRGCHRPQYRIKRERATKVARSCDEGRKGVRRRSQGRATKVARSFDPGRTVAKKAVFMNLSAAVWGAFRVAAFGLTRSQRP